MISAIVFELAKKKGIFPFSLDAAEKNVKLSCIDFCTSTKF